MLIVAPTIALIIGLLVWAGWQRRLSWNSKWEKHATQAMVWTAAGVILMSSAITGHTGIIARWSVALGGIAFCAAVVRCCQGWLLQILPEPAAKKKTFRWLIIPSAIGQIIMLTTMALSGGLSMRGDHALIHYATDKPLPPIAKAWWITGGLLMVWLTSVAAKVLTVIRKDPPRRAVADTFLVATLAGFTLGPLTIAMAWINHDEWIPVAATILTAFWLGIYSLASVHSWQARMAPYKDLLDVIASPHEVHDAPYSRTTRIHDAPPL